MSPAESPGELQSLPLATILSGMASVPLRFSSGTPRRAFPTDGLCSSPGGLNRDVVQSVLFNPEMTDMMLQTTTPRVLLNKGDIWKDKRSNLNHLLAVALVPLFVTSAMVWLARRWAKSGPLITLRIPEWKAKPVTPG